MEVAKDLWSITTSNNVPAASPEQWNELCEQMMAVLDPRHDATVARAAKALAHCGEPARHQLRRWGGAYNPLAEKLAGNLERLNTAGSDFNDVFAMIATPSSTSAHLKARAQTSTPTPAPSPSLAAPLVLQFAKPGNLHAATIQKTEYVLGSWIPRGVVTLLGAHGGVGKTNLALTKAALLAAGEALGSWGCMFAGHCFEPCRVLFVSLEDSIDVIRWRLRNIVEEYGLDAALVDRNLDILDGTQTNPTLAVEISQQGTRQLAFTQSMDQIAQMTPAGGLLIVDNNADAFAGDQNNPMLVKQYIRRFARIAREKNAGVLLLHHIDKAAARYGAAGESYMGTAVWNNSVRSRLSLVADDGVIELRHEKANLGPKAKPVALRFTDSGVLVPVERHVNSVHAEDQQLVACISAALGRNESVSTARSGPASAFSAAKNLPGFPPELRRADRFWAAINRLVDSGRLRRDSYQNANYKLRERFIPSANPPVSANA